MNSVHPGTVDTDMVHNPATYKLVAPDVGVPTRETVALRFQELNTLPVPWIEPVDVSNAILWLASDEARYITGVALPVDAGQSLK